MGRKVLTKKTYRYLAIGWATLIAVLSLTPGEFIPPDPFEFIRADNIAHFSFYALLTVFLLAGSKKIPTLKIFLTIIFLASMYGFLIEIIQILIPGRHFDWYDVIVNSLGVLGGLFFFSIIYGKHNKSSSV